MPCFAYDIDRIDLRRRTDVHDFGIDDDTVVQIVGCLLQRFVTGQDVAFCRPSLDASGADLHPVSLFLKDIAGGTVAQLSDDVLHVDTVRLAPDIDITAHIDYAEVPVGSCGIRKPLLQPHLRKFLCRHRLYHGNGLFFRFRIRIGTPGPMPAADAVNDHAGAYSD